MEEFIQYLKNFCTESPKRHGIKAHAPLSLFESFPKTSRTSPNAMEPKPMHLSPCLRAFQRHLEQVQTPWNQSPCTSLLVRELSKDTKNFTWSKASQFGGSHKLQSKNKLPSFIDRWCSCNKWYLPNQKATWKSDAPFYVPYGMTTLLKAWMLNSENPICDYVCAVSSFACMQAFK